MIEPRPRPGLTGRPRIILIALTISFIVLVLRLWSLQVVHASRYRELGLLNRKRGVTVRPERGRILDRYGRPLADNRPRLDACVDYSDVTTRAELDRVVEVLADVLAMPPQAIRDSLDPKNVVPYVPVAVKRDISFEQYARLKVLEPLTPGLMPMTNFARRCRYGELAAQVLGYTGLVPGPETLEQLRAAHPELEYDGRDVVGLAGLELEFEPQLQGRKGHTTIEVDNMGRRRRILDDKDKPLPGSDVTTTLDVELQALAQRVLADKRGALVAMDPRNGDLLVLASTPSFDPNLFAIPRSADAVAAIERLNSDEARPLWNRCISDQHPLGSAFKAVVALAALNLPKDKGGITGETVFNCPGTFSLGRYTWDCYHQNAHGDMTVVTAIKKSCNVFFYKTGHQIGREPIVSLAAQFGLGEPTGVPLPNERAGVNPTSEWQTSGDWRARDYASWYSGYTVNLSIGQFPLEVTPLQVAQLYAAVAMDGVLAEPRLVSRIVGAGGTEEFPPQSRRIELSAESLALVKEGLREVTREGGTGYSAFRNLQHLNVAGKTSTAEVGPKDARTNLAWFIAFAPADAPQIVVVVMIEEGQTGGRTAAPLAAEFLEAYFARADEAAAADTPPAEARKEKEE
jgi:penicillin-binding protein 2